MPKKILLLLTGLLLASATPPMIFSAAPTGDWADWRGPARDGRSPETGLPSHWSPDGENLAWKAPYGGRSAPIVMGDRLFLQNPAGEGETLQERILCLNADTGALLWEHRFNIYQSDVPPHRVAWASPAGDPATGNIYAFGVGGNLLALDHDGTLLWERSLGEDFGLVTTHGGRTVSPLIDGDLVIVSGLNSGWGNQARGGQRFFAFDKTTGETLWVSSPGGQPYDTTYAPFITTEIGGTRLLLAGGGDGAVHALKPQTGEPVWRYEISKRGINSGALVNGTTAIVSQGEENIDTSEMGLIAAIDATATGEIKKEQVKWEVPGFLGGYSSPVMDGDRVYQIDNGANLVAFDLETGNRLWTLSLGTIQRSSPVLADGKLYVGTANGTFYIIRPGAEEGEILDQDELGGGAEIEEIIASVAVARGRVYLVSQEATYAIGAGAASEDTVQEAAREMPPAGPATHVQVTPTELVLSPGENVQFAAWLFDEKGRLSGRAEAAAWTLEGLEGTVGGDGEFTASTETVAQAGQIKATVGDLSGTARLRVIPPLPWSEGFEGMDVDSVPRHWVSATGKYRVRQEEGNKVLVKLADNPFLKRTKTYLGPSDWSDYTVAIDVRASEQRRQMGDAGVIAQRYALILFGNHQRLELMPWQPETQRTVSQPFPWQADTWYRLKLQVENLADGTVRARGKAWPKSEPEPSDWTVERIDPIPNREGSPGIYADATNEVFFDDLEVTENP
ncbi:MAG TPA: PQQ-binding-like beta-propeller repeat protein [Vicinamibacteria bacterium]|jgi:outer membrane protein assembly factor BamB